MSNCTICRCEATHEKLGFRVCLYHLSHGEDDPRCPICHHPPEAVVTDGTATEDMRPSEPRIPDAPTILTDPDKIAGFRLLAMYHAMRLEAKGLHHSSGKSITALVKREFSLKGNRQRVIDQFERILRDRRILLRPEAPRVPHA